MNYSITPMKKKIDSEKAVWGSAALRQNKNVSLLLEIYIYVQCIVNLIQLVGQTTHVSCSHSPPGKCVSLTATSENFLGTTLQCNKRKTTIFI